ncbi:hypothetical protein [Azonexus hydrophilus]|uniref:Cell division protein FtsL n=1 Tax=Azonexus hydrophilus TaxID=418702 RepID=A0ABZ2XFN0_9RHOO
MLPTIPAGITEALGRWALIALIGTLLFFGGWRIGVERTEKAQAEKLLDVTLAYAERIVELQGVGESLTAENATLRAAQAPKERIVTREVLRYVEVTPPDRRVVLPGTWRVRHDAAAAGTVPEGSATGPLADGAGGTHEAAPVPDNVALETVGDNYRTCRETEAKLEGWQRRQRVLAGAKP